VASPHRNIEDTELGAIEERIIARCVEAWAR
jgi:hypothetical protein